MGGDVSLGKDEALELLQDDRRRIVLAHLRERKGEDVSLEWLVQRVVDAEPTVTGPEEHPGEATRRIAVSLHHAQLPKLAAAGVVAYDREGRTCQYLGDATLEALLDAIGGYETHDGT